LLALLGSDVSNPEDGGPPSAGTDDGGDGAGRAAGTGEVTGTGAAAAGDFILMSMPLYERD